MTVGTIHREFGLMVDYFALISPTIEPLANASFEERKVVYDRLVTMLDQQLRAAEPPRSDKDILKERINLEAAIRRVERRVLSGQRADLKKKTAPDTEIIKHSPLKPTVADPSDADQNAVATPAAREPDIVLPEHKPALSEEVRQNEAVEPTPEPLVVEPLNHKPDHLVAIEPEPDVSEAVSPPEASSDVPPTEAIISADDQIIESTVPEAPETFEALNTVSPPVEGLACMPEISNATALADLAEDATDKLDYHNLPLEAPLPAGDVVIEQEWPMAEKAPDLRPGLPSAGAIRARGAGPSQQTKGLWLRIGIIALVIMALVASIGGIAEFLAQQSAEHKAERGPAPVQQEPSIEQKLADRLPIAPDEQPKTAVIPNGGKGTTANDASIAGEPNDADILIQRAILLEEPPGGLGDPKRKIGRVTWKLETLRSTLTNTSDIGARATIDLAEAGLSANFVFRRNRDQTSANTHLIEITVTPSADNPNGKIRDVSVPELRVDEKTRGANLAGIAVPVADNVFLIGLSGLPTDMQRNIELLRSRNWFLVPMRYSNGKRALLMFEKGKPGERVFEDAMQTWQ